MSKLNAEHRRPVLQPSSQLEWVVGDNDAGAAHSLAQETSWALLDRVRRVADPEVVERVVHLAARDGIDDIAELWANSSAHSLAGQLWRIYLLRRVVDADPRGTAVVFRAGHDVAETIDPIVAGVAEPIGPETISALCDTILRGAFTGDLAVALERASSYCQVMSLGAASIADDLDWVDGERASELTQRSLRYSSFSNDLRAGARRWRDGTLT